MEQSEKEYFDYIFNQGLYGPVGLFCKTFRSLKQSLVEVYGLGTLTDEGPELLGDLETKASRIKTTLAELQGLTEGFQDSLYAKLG